MTDLLRTRIGHAALVSRAVYPGQEWRSPSAELATWLRWRTQRLRQATKRRAFPSVLEILALPPEPSAAPLCAYAPAEHATDHALRVDLLLKMLQNEAVAISEGQVALVHVRPGPPEVADVDLAWWAAGRWSEHLAGVDVVCAVAVTRWGWVDVASGQRRTWSRLRG